MLPSLCPCLVPGVILSFRLGLGLGLRLRLGAATGAGAGVEQSISIRSANALFLHTASKEALRVIAQGMERAAKDSNTAGEHSLDKEGGKEGGREGLERRETEEGGNKEGRGE